MSRGAPRSRTRRLGKQAAYAIAERLPAGTRDGFLEVARAVGSYFRGDGGASSDGGEPATRYREPRVSGRLFGRAALALERGDLDAALEQTADLVRRYPTSARVLDLRGRVLGKSGELTERAAVLHRRHSLTGDPLGVEQERGVLARVVETTPGWLPHLPGPAERLEPAGDDIVLHLLKASVPYATTGFTMRQRYNFIAAMQAGVRPVGVTELGFPRALGVTSFPRFEELDGIPHYHLDLGPTYPTDRPVDLLLADQAALIARVVREVRPAVIHASSGHRGYELALVGLALRRRFGIPLVYEVRSFFDASWTTDESLHGRAEQSDRRFETETRTMLAADHVLTIAEAMRDEIIERGIAPERVSVVPNSVDVDVFTPRPPDPALQARYGLEGMFTFGYVSNIDHPREGHELLLDATRVLRARGRRVRCLIVGDGTRAEEVRGYARQIGVGDDAVFTGLVPHDEVPGHYALMDVFVVPRRDERFARVVTPLKPYEALAMARPMILTDLPAHREIAAPDERGLVVPPADPEALADAIERLMDDPALAARIGENGRAWVAGNRRWSDNGPRFREAYRRALERSRAPGWPD
ncbi:MAG TPA: glycosyltransferase family 4 protein [Candidatus Limnocylindrales bacterium]|nr:glycosyltransferase family 4 protein [Candidatus Limnocylindrales bacterium]